MAMTQEEAIKYLQQLYPNGGCCWLDEQRIEAIGMAIELLKESVSEDLKEAAEKHALQCYSKEASTATLAASEYDFIAGANWKEQQMMKDAVEGYVCFNETAHNYDEHDHCVISNEEPKEAFSNRGLKIGDKVKLIIVKEDKV